MFVYPILRVTCNECGENDVDIPVEPAGRGGFTVEAPSEYLGWKISEARQVCPECDAKLEGN